VDRLPETGRNCPGTVMSRSRGHVSDIASRPIHVKKYGVTLPRAEIWEPPASRSSFIRKDSRARRQIFPPSSIPHAHKEKSLYSTRDLRVYMSASSSNGLNPRRNSGNGKGYESKPHCSTTPRIQAAASTSAHRGNPRAQNERSFPC